MKGKIIFLIIPFLFSICPIFAASEEGDYLTSEEEILEALSRDEISFTQYYDLIELFREKVSVFGEDIDRLLLIPGVDERWIEAIRATSDHVGPFADKKTFIDWFPFDFERISAFVTFEQFRKGNIGGGAKIYTHGRFIENDLPTSYFTVNARYAKQKAEIRFSQDKDSIRVRRRGIEIPVFSGKLILGSFYQGLGEGLILGKHFHVPGSMRKNSTIESSVSPYDNLFNGLRFATDIRKIGVGILASRDVYSSVAVDALGAALSFAPTDSLNIGAVYAYGAVGARPGHSSYRQSCGSIFGSFEFFGNELASEFGFIDNGSKGIMLTNIKKISGARTLFEFWSYDKNFNPLHSKGLSDYRETDIELGETGIEQGSPQAGETGAELKITAPLYKTLSWNIDQSGWTTRSQGDWGILSQEGVYYRDSGGRHGIVDFGWEKRTLSSGINLKETIRASFVSPIFKVIECEGYCRLRWTTKPTDRVRSLSSYIEITDKHFEPFRISVRVKRMKTNLALSGNGYWELRLCDEFKSGPIMWTGELRHAIYDDKSKDALTEFKINAGYIWR